MRKSQFFQDQADTMPSTMVVQQKGGAQTQSRPFRWIQSGKKTGRKLLGSGGFGDVYEFDNFYAMKPQTGQRRKILQKLYRDPDPQTFHQVIRKDRLLSQVLDPERQVFGSQIVGFNFPRSIDILHQGISLKQLVQKIKSGSEGAPPLRNVVINFIFLCIRLGELYNRHHYIYKDMSQDNIMYNESEQRFKFIDIDGLEYTDNPETVSQNIKDFVQVIYNTFKSLFTGNPIFKSWKKIEESSEKYTWEQIGAQFEDLLRSIGG